MARILVLTLAVAAMVVGGAGGALKQARPAWLPKLYWAIGMCETGLRWDWNSGTYQGAFGFYTGSWDQYKPAGYPAEAYQATPRQQLVVAQRIAQRVGLDAWGCVSHGGYRVWLARA